MNSFTHRYFAYFCVSIYFRNDQSLLLLLKQFILDLSAFKSYEPSVQLLICQFILTLIWKILICGSIFLCLGYLIASLLLYWFQRQKWMRWLNLKRQDPNFEDNLSEELKQKYRSFENLSWQGFQRLGMHLEMPNLWARIFLKSSSYLLFLVILMSLLFSDQFNENGMFSLFILALERYFLFGLFFVILEIKLSNLEIA